MEKTVVIKGKGANKEEIMKNISDSLDEIFANNINQNMQKKKIILLLILK